ncbi:MAG: redoxin domain-containing protein [Nitrospinae bacterium]|nr:redoxin domain-containing protein [Nitrospinota bacterium]
MGIRTRMSLVLGVFAFGLFYGAGGAGSLETFRALPPERYHPAPAFALLDQHGTTIRLADLQGKVVVLQFWVTW